MLLWGLLALPGLGATPTVDQWVEAWGEPSKSVALTQRVRSPTEPLLLYWMEVRADPLGVGVVLPGTLVANFVADTAQLQDFTFLAVATQAQTSELVQALRKRGWIAGESTVKRAGGPRLDYALGLPDGQSGTLSVRHHGGGPGMADGRPAPTLWLHVGPSSS